jgi:hypothetical protein
MTKDLSTNGLSTPHSFLFIALFLMSCDCTQPQFRAIFFDFKQNYLDLALEQAIPLRRHDLCCPVTTCVVFTVKGIGGCFGPA